MRKSFLQGSYQKHRISIDLSVYSDMELLMTIYLLLFVQIIFYLCKSVLQKRNHCCYMLHYECHKPSEDRKVNVESYLKVFQRNKNLGLEEHKFLSKIMARSGIGEETYGPANLVQGREEFSTLMDALSESDDAIFNTLDKLFVKTGVSPSEIDILVVNLSLFATAPSLTARVINRYKMRENIKAFNLSGMGCSASIIAIDLVQRLFKSYKNTYAIVVSTETMGLHWYGGGEKSMMLTHCLFRSGGCSMLLTNNRALKHQAILKLTCTVRTHLGSDDEAYGCCIQVEDEQGYQGVTLTKNLPKVGAKAMMTNFQVLLPRVLPLKELLRYAISSLFISKIKRKSSLGQEVQGSAPDLKTGIVHFCIHPGGKAVIHGIAKSLGLNEHDAEPARMALHRFGNTSSAGLWYVLGYMEAKKRLKKGDRILMISLGAGFKCNTCVWEVMNNRQDANVWKDDIDRYPEASEMANPFYEKRDWIPNEDLGFARSP